MKAFVYEGNGKPELKEVQVPEPTSQNVISKVLACSICGTDIRIYANGSSKIEPPRIIGHEICAEIVHIGDSVRLNGFSVGQRVLIAPAIGCGECAPCRKGYTNLCTNLKTLGFQYDGGFAEIMEIPMQAFRMGNVIPVSGPLEVEDVILCEPVACAFNGQQLLKIGPDDTVVIFGAGFIGCIHAELAGLKGVRNIIMVEFSGYRAEQAERTIPGISIIDPGKTEVVNKIMELTDGIGADVLITACSAGITHSQALRAAAPRGRISLFGGLPEPSSGYLDSNLIHYRELGVFGVHASTAEQNRKILGLVESGELNLKKYISRIYSLDDINKAFEDIKTEPIFKAIVKP